MSRSEHSSDESWTNLPVHTHTGNAYSKRRRCVQDAGKSSDRKSSESIRYWKSHFDEDMRDGSPVAEATTCPGCVCIYLFFDLFRIVEIELEECVQRSANCKGSEMQFVWKLLDRSRVPVTKPVRETSAKKQTKPTSLWESQFANYRNFVICLLKKKFRHIWPILKQNHEHFKHNFVNFDNIKANKAYFSPCILICKFKILKFILIYLYKNKKDFRHIWPIQNRNYEHFKFRLIYSTIFLLTASFVANLRWYESFNLVFEKYWEKGSRKYTLFVF